MAPLVVIVGPTASGKTAAAIELAERCGGEIICADSRTIYRYMDIGTAKPTSQDQARVPHWGLDLVEPGERFTVADFKTYAVQKIAEIRDRGGVPFLVGGTGLYVDAIVLDYQFGPDANLDQRKRFESMTVEQLHKYCSDNNINLPDNKYNKRYVIRAIEQSTDTIRGKDSPISNSIIVGIATDRAVLRERIQQRSMLLFQHGMVEEADRLAERYGWHSEAMTGNIYRLVYQFRSGEINESELVERFEIADWQLAKRQLTWLKRRDFIEWLSLEQVVPYLSDRLADYKK